MGKRNIIEAKRKVVELHRQGLGNRLISRQTGINRSEVKFWLSQYREHGESFLDPVLPPVEHGYAFREKVVRDVLEKGLSLRKAAARYCIQLEMVRRWVKRVKAGGYESVMGRKRKKDIAELSEVERLRIELERARTEVALLKKVKALVEERERGLKETGRGPSRH